MMTKYPTYKPTNIPWIGEIPEHWEKRRFKFEANYVKGKNPQDLKLVASENAEVYLAMDYLRGEPKKTFYVDNPDKYLNVDDNDLLLLWDGSNAGEFIRSKRGVLSSTMALISTDKLNNNYAFYFLKSFERILKDATIGMGIPHVNGEELKNSIVLIPSHQEQTTIAQFLDDKTAEIDQLIAKKQTLIERLQEEKQALINQAVTKGIDPKAKMKDSGLSWVGKIPEHWEVKKLKYIIKSLDSGVSVNATDFPASPQEIGVLKTSCVYSNSFNPLENKKVWKNELERVSCPVKGNSIIISRMNTPDLVGASGYVEVDYPHLFLPDRLWQTNFFDLNEIDVKWLSFLFISSRFHQILKSSATGTSPSMKNISKNDLLSISIPFPKKDEQQKVRDFIDKKVSDIDRTTSEIKKEITLIQEYKTSLIAEAVTGKIDVRSYTTIKKYNL